MSQKSMIHVGGVGRHTDELNARGFLIFRWGYIGVFQCNIK